MGYMNRPGYRRTHLMNLDEKPDVRDLFGKLAFGYENTRLAMESGRVLTRRIAGTTRKYYISGTPFTFSVMDDAVKSAQVSYSNYCHIQIATYTLLEDERYLKAVRDIMEPYCQEKCDFENLQEGALYRVGYDPKGKRPEDTSKYIFFENDGKSKLPRGGRIFCWGANQIRYEGPGGTVGKDGLPLVEYFSGLLDGRDGSIQAKRRLISRMTDEQKAAAGVE